MRGKLIIFSAPSGSGKTTIVHHLLNTFPELEFSISATSREKRGKERNGVDYYFLTSEQFRQKIRDNELLEWEEVYPGRFYGTLKSEVERIWGKNKTLIFDIDVAGALNLKQQFGQNALSVFVDVPSLEELENRLRGRSTDAEEIIKERIKKAEEERRAASEFDVILMNNDLNKALKEAETLVSNFLSR